MSLASDADITIKNFDHLGLIAAMFDKVGIADVVNRLIPSDEQKLLSHANALKAMVINGLGFVSKPLYLVPEFFTDKPLEKLFTDPSLTADMINQFSLGRSLDAFFEYGVTELFQAISAEALSRLNLVPKQIHLDSTSFHVDGRYNSDDDAPEGVVHITQGYSRDHRPDLNQVTLNLLVESQAGVPLFMQAASGNQSDKSAFEKVVREHYAKLHAAHQSPFLIADSALYCASTLGSIKEQGILFISRVPGTLKDAKVLLANSHSANWITLDESYAAYEVTSNYGDLGQRWIVIRSSHASKRETITALRALQKQGERECKALASLQRQSFFCEADAISALDQFREALKVTQIIDSRIESIAKHKKRGRPSANNTPDQWHYQVRATIATPLEQCNQQCADAGIFILATNDKTLTANQILVEYKSQQRVERGFRFLKSPEFLASSVYLKNPKRVEALLMVMTVCLLVYCALEYESRKVLQKEKPFFPDQKKKPTQIPTARWIFACFAAIHLLIAEKPIVIGVKEYQKRLLELLGKEFSAMYS
jgi:transposase